MKTTILVLASLALISCAKKSDSAQTAPVSAPPVAHIADVSVTSTDVKGSARTFDGEAVQFAASSGKGERYESQGVMDIMLGDGNLHSCTDEMRASGMSSMAVVRLPLDVHAGSSYIGDIAAAPSTTEDRVYFNQTTSDGFTQSPFKKYSVYIFDVDATHIHGVIEASDQVSSSKSSDTTFMRGEFNVPFCDQSK